MRNSAFPICIVASVALAAPGCGSNELSLWSNPLGTSSTTLAPSSNPKAPAAATSGLSDDEIARRLIQASRNAYPAWCGCPEDLDRDGRRCGGRSAYSQRVAKPPLCYPKDVKREMIERYRREHT